MNTITSVIDGIFDTGLLSPGSTASIDTSALEAGDYPFTSTLNPDIQGTIVVEEVLPIAADTTSDTVAAAPSSTPDTGNEFTQGQTEVTEEAEDFAGTTSIPATPEMGTPTLPPSSASPLTTESSSTPDTESQFSNKFGLDGSQNVNLENGVSYPIKYRITDGQVIGMSLESTSDGKPSLIIDIASEATEADNGKLLLEIPNTVLDPNRKLVVYDEYALAQWKELAQDPQAIVLEVGFPVSVLPGQTTIEIVGQQSQPQPPPQLPPGNVPTQQPTSDPLLDSIIREKQQEQQPQSDPLLDAIISQKQQEQRTLGPSPPVESNSPAATTSAHSELSSEDIETETIEERSQDDFITMNAANAGSELFSKSLDEISMNPVPRSNDYVIKNIKGITDQFTTHNSSTIGITLSYPSNWTQTENVNNITFSSPNQNDSKGFPADVMITISVQPTNNLTLDELVNMKIQEYYAINHNQSDYFDFYQTDRYGNYYEANVERKNPSALSMTGYPTQTFFYSGRGGFPTEEGWNGIDSLFTVGNKLYHIIFRSQSEEFLFLRDIILDTLEVNDNTGPLQERNSEQLVRYHNISKSPMLNDEVPQIVVSDRGDVYIVWSQEDEDGIFFSRSIDNGTNFSDPIQLDNGSATHLSEPQIVSNEENVYIVWRSDDATAFTKSSDYGASFSPEKTLNYEVKITTEDGDEDIVNLNDAVLSAYDKYVYLLIYARSDVNPNPVLFVRSMDNGDTFEDPIYLSQKGVEGLAATAISNNGTVYVSWFGVNGPVLKKSVDYGATFANEIDLFKKSCSFPDAALVRLIADDNNLYAACLHYEIYESAPSEIGTRRLVEFQVPLFTRSIDGATAFGHIYSLENKTIEPMAYTLDMDANKNNAYLAWEAPGDDGVSFRRSIDNGTTFGNILQIANEYDAVNPQAGGVSYYIMDIEAAGEDLSVLWNSAWYNADPPHEHQNEVVLGTGHKKGLVFDLPLNVSQGHFIGDVEGSDMAVSEDYTFVVWTNLLKVKDEEGDEEIETKDIHLARIPNN